jgi:hypothetical protein
MGRMTLGVAVLFAAAFLVALGVAWTRERRRRERLERATLALLVICVAGGFVAISDQNRDIEQTQQDIKQTQARVERETRQRRHQICLGDEREHLAAVNRLERTYAYLVELDPERPLSLLNQAILRQLPDIENDARTDQAPAFCDLPGEEVETLWRRTHGKRGSPPVGLQEPDPELPERPASLPELR